MFGEGKISLGHVIAVCLELMSLHGSSCFKFFVPIALYLNYIIMSISEKLFEFGRFLGDKSIELRGALAADCAEGSGGLDEFLRTEFF